MNWGLWRIEVRSVMKWDQWVINWCCDGVISVVKWGFWWSEVWMKWVMWWNEVCDKIRSGRWWNGVFDEMRTGLWWGELSDWRSYVCDEVKSVMIWGLWCSEVCDNAFVSFYCWWFVSKLTKIFFFWMKIELTWFLSCSQIAIFLLFFDIQQQS